MERFADSSTRRHSVHNRLQVRRLSIIGKVGLPRCVLVFHPARSFCSVSSSASDLFFSENPLWRLVCDQRHRPQPTSTWSRGGRSYPYQPCASLSLTLLRFQTWDPSKFEIQPSSGRPVHSASFLFCRDGAPVLKTSYLLISVGVEGSRFSASMAALTNRGRGTSTDGAEAFLPDPVFFSPLLSSWIKRGIGTALLCCLMQTLWRTWMIPTRWTWTRPRSLPSLRGPCIRLAQRPLRVLVALHSDLHCCLCTGLFSRAPPRKEYCAIPRRLLGARR